MSDIVHVCVKVIHPAPLSLIKQERVFEIACHQPLNANGMAISGTTLSYASIFLFKPLEPFTMQIHFAYSALMALQIKTPIQNITGTNNRCSVCSLQHVVGCSLDLSVSDVF